MNENIDQYLFDCLNTVNDVHQLKLEELFVGHNSVEIECILLYFDAMQLYCDSSEYSQTRLVQGVPIASFECIEHKLNSANSLLAMYKSALILRVPVDTLRIFINQWLVEALENLLFIFGGIGYCLENPSTQVWIRCRERIRKISRQEVL